VFAVLEPWKRLSLGILQRLEFTQRAYNHMILRSYCCERVTPGEGSCSENMSTSQGIKQYRSPPCAYLLNIRQEHSTSIRQDDGFGDSLNIAQ